MSFGKLAPAGDRVEQFGQQAGDRVRRTARQQPGRLGVAPVATQTVDQPVGERGAPPTDHDRAQQSTADGLGRVDERRLVDGVGDLEAVRNTQGVAPDVRIGVGDVCGDPVRVTGDGRRDDGDAALVGAAGFECLQQGPQGVAHVPYTRGEFAHALRVREGVEGVQQTVGLGFGFGRVIDLVLRGAGHALDSACSWPPRGLDFEKRSFAYCWCWCVRRRLRRSFSDRPPQTPNRSSLASAYWRQAGRISHSAQMRFASRTELPGSGKKKSAPVCAHSACSCQERSGAAVLSKCMAVMVPGSEKRLLNVGSTGAGVRLRYTA